MKDNQVNRIKSDMIAEHGLAMCKLATRHLVESAVAHPEPILEIFKGIGGNPLLEEVQDIIRDLQATDQRTRLAIIKRFL